MRIIFIHGLGETKSCFRKIAAELPGEHTFISLWEALGDKKRPELIVIGFCNELIESYNIRSEDIIIGHSTGAKLAYFIKHLNGNKIIQIAGWTDQSKVILPIKNIKLIYFLVRSGLLFLDVVNQYVIDRYKRRDESKPFYVEALTNLKSGNRNCVLNQYKLALSNVEEEVSVEPDLRIHAKRDNIIRYPDESFHEVPGDHFSLLTYPDEVLSGIRSVIDLQS
ncbi:MAG: alpha/beta hydrolase [Cyclobacteriaceae bacterium]